MYWKQIYIYTPIYLVNNILQQKVCTSEQTLKGLFTCILLSKDIVSNTCSVSNSVSLSLWSLH